VADEKQRARMIDRQHHDRTLAGLVVVEVAAIVSRRPGSRSEVAGRRDTHASQHRFSRKLQLDYIARRLFQPHGLAFEVKLPRNQIGSPGTDQIIFVTVRVETFDRFGRQRKQSEPVGSEAPPAVQPNPRKVDDERVGRLRAFNVERPGQRVAGLATADILLVLTAGVNRFSDDSVARTHALERGVGAGEGVMISCGYYLMNLGRRYGSPADIHTQDNGEQRGAR